MKLLELSKVAQAYYEGLRAPSLAQGWDKYVATDGQNCLFVHSDTTRNRQTSIQIYKHNEL